MNYRIGIIVVALQEVYQKGRKKGLKEGWNGCMVATGLEFWQK